MPHRLIHAALIHAAVVALLITIPAAALEAATAGTPLGDVTSTGRLAPNVLELALSTARCAQQSLPVANPRLLTLIDYSRPSTTRRLWVIDIETGRVLFEELVAHGRASGGNLTSHFSNEPGSLASSLGLFLTGETYVGSNGYSLRLEGLEEGVNHRAFERAIVMHGAPYVDDVLARKQGRIGRSWGCPALREAIARDVIDTVRGGGVIFSYYPDEKWLTTSRFLNCGPA